MASLNTRFNLSAGKKLALTLVGIVALGCWISQVDAAPPAFKLVTGDQIKAPPASEWLGYGRDYSEQRFAPQTQITQANIKQLALGWHYDFGGERQGFEATPLVHDGVMYVSTDFSEVWAFDAVTGKKLWSYDPETRAAQIKTCCSPINRGVAIWGDKVFVGALDGRLIALNAKTGKPVWSTQTFPKTSRLSITGAPRVIKGVVVIGNGGAELGVRGFVAGYDANTGVQKWKFYTVPGKTDADGAASDSAMKIAFPTWKGKGEWTEYGGGGTPWDGMAYDPDLDLLYVGVGNGAPWNATMRSPGGGDNLFLGSVIAIRPETGKYVWHFQETPGDSWDYTSTQPIVLADITINGAKRKVLMHAPKNGFFYVLDRETGKFIQGKAYAHVNWAKGLDANGRPIEDPRARFGATGKPWMGSPGPGGAHNWQPMAYSPKTGLVYIPQIESGFVYLDDKTEGGAGFKETGFNTGAGAFSATTRVPSKGPAPADENKNLPGAESATAAWGGFLLAWDPVKQEARFKIPQEKYFNGGTLATAGGLVFAGTHVGDFTAYHDETGAKLWTFPAQTGIVAAPMTYEIGGVQYVAVMAGWGGTAAPYGPRTSSNGPARLLVFKLGGTDTLPPKPAYQPPPLAPPAQTESAAVIDLGAQMYARNCMRCHGGGAAGGGLGTTGPADLRRSAFIQSQDAFNAAVLDGVLQQQGMASFKGDVTPEQAKAIRAYIIYQAQAAKAAGDK
jgi:alcohol dehydrogenase (cytochrome c)/quinohemoprotein ethanol dehydrogenase